jgi:hypothetical protein
MGVARHSSLRRVGVAECPVFRSAKGPYLDVATLSQIGVTLQEEASANVSVADVNVGVGTGAGSGAGTGAGTGDVSPVFYKRDTGPMKGVALSYLAKQAWYLSADQSRYVGMPFYPYWIIKEETVLVWGNLGTAVVPKSTLFAVRQCSRHCNPQLALRHATANTDAPMVASPRTVMFANSPQEIVNGYKMPIWLDMATVVACPDPPFAEETNNADKVTVLAPPQPAAAGPHSINSGS